MPVVIPDIHNYAEADAVLCGLRYEAEREHSYGRHYRTTIRRVGGLIHGQPVETWTRPRTSLIVGRNTRLIRLPTRDGAKGRIAVRLHSTDIVTYCEEGTIVLTSGGWHTMVTADRITSFTPCRIGSTEQIGWRICPDTRWPTITDPVFMDGTRVHDDGTFHSSPGAIPAPYVTVSGWTGLTRGGRRP